MDKVRVMRILIYGGTREWVESTLKEGVIPLNGTRSLGSGRDGVEYLIKSVSIDAFPEILESK